MVLTFREFRKVKDSLPSGGIKKIASKLELEEETVRNYFGGSDYRKGKSPGVHFERGINGGYVRLDDEKIFKAAVALVNKRRS